MNETTVVMGALNDIHMIGITLLERALVQGGFHVVNLRAMASQEDFINAAVETGARAILVSSLYGHAQMDCMGLREKCMEAGLGDIVLYVGGNLSVRQEDSENIFKAMGFNRVYRSGQPLNQVVDDLRKDLAISR